MEFEFNFKGKKRIDVDVCDSVWKKFLGLMFRRESPALLFTFDRFKRLDIHSLFCKPFFALWLDGNKNVIQVRYIDKWRMFIPGNGRYLIEIPVSRRDIWRKVGLSRRNQRKV